MRYRRVLEAGATYFFTLVTHRREPLLADPSNITRWRGAVAKVQRSRPFIVEGEVVLPDHLHVLWTLPDGDAEFATRIRLVKTAFTKSLGALDAAPRKSSSRARRGEREVWQRRYWEHLVRDERDFRAHLDYIHLNPIRHGLVARPGDWPHSTFHIWVDRGAYEAWWGTDELPPLPEWVGSE
jgi:REP-associated tyrosine transposase